MYQSVNLFYEPLEILKRLAGGEEHSEMTIEEQAFLCGMIKDCKPKKIVEIGVAAGGTTAVIMNCVSMLELEAKIYSIDLSPEYYRNTNMETGFLAKECKTLLHEKIDHTFCIGQYAIEYLESIGEDIDFIILDTAHSLPGEILDFLASFPFLKQGATIVLHDVMLNHLNGNTNAFATKLLFDTAVGIKFMNRGSDGNFLNIGAFTITEDTHRYIEDIFSSLTITWKYLPSDAALGMYRVFLGKYYTEGQLKIFDMAVELNRKTLKERSEKRFEDFVKSCKWIMSIKAKRIYVYGCGNFGKCFYNLLEQCGMELGGYIISDGQRKIEEVQNVYYLSEVNLGKEEMILVGVNVSLQKEICNNLRRIGIENYILPNNEIYSCLM